MKSGAQLLLILSVFLTTANSSFAQDTAKNRQAKRYTPLPLIPQFPGGRDSLALFIKKNTHYPSSAKKHHITGIIEVDFVMNKEGQITKAHVLKSLSLSCDKEALRVVKLMPHWRPGMLGRDPIEMDYHVDIPFGTELPKQNNP
jgi:TonB family protein